ncbi:MAG: hypothetical protein AVDCRST_MAG05-5067, partial [uncultured Rubrobacteraceae bacterium]
GRKSLPHRRVVAQERGAGQDDPALLRRRRASPFRQERGGLPLVLRGGPLAAGVDPDPPGRRFRAPGHRTHVPTRAASHRGRPAPARGREPPAKDARATAGAARGHPGGRRRGGALLPGPGARPGDAHGARAAGLPRGALRARPGRHPRRPGRQGVVQADDRRGVAGDAHRRAARGVGGALRARRRRRVYSDAAGADGAVLETGRRQLRPGRLARDHRRGVPGGGRGRARRSPADGGARAARGGSPGRGPRAGDEQDRRPGVRGLASAPLRRDGRPAHGALLAARLRPQRDRLRPDRRRSPTLAYRRPAPAGRAAPRIRPRPEGL